MTSGAPPALPVPLAGVVKYISQHPKTPMGELLEPYRKYEAHLRRAFAQDPGSELLKDPLVNVLPLFTEDIPDIKIRARKLENETKAEKSKYIMPLPAELRRPDGTAAVVQSFKEFQHNFNVFSESSLVEIDWYVLPWRRAGVPAIEENSPANLALQEQRGGCRIVRCQLSAPGPGRVQALQARAPRVLS